MPYKDKEVNKAYVRKWQNKVRRKLYDLKESKPCTDCGKFYPHYVMQFDHKEDKKFTISQHSASFGRKAIYDEIAKCDLVCANCHASRTYKRQHAEVAETVQAPV